MKEDQQKLPVSIAVVKALADTGHVLPYEAAALADAAAAAPRPSDWLRFLSWFLVFAGAALSLAGVVFFFAYNWAHLGRFAKLGTLELCIIAATVGAWKLGDRIGGRVLLMAAVILVGPLLAVYGQTYQTGADPYELFLGWTALTLPWVVLARMPALWLTTLLLVNTTFLLYWGQILDGRYDFGESVPAYLVLAVINILPWVVWESLQRWGISWMTPRWAPRVMGLAGCATLVVCLSVMILGEANDTSGYGLVAVLAGIAVTSGSIVYYRTYLPDLFMIALAAASTIIVVTIGFGRILFDEMGAEITGAFALGLFVVAEVAGTATWLRHEGRRINRISAKVAPEGEAAS